MLSPTWSSCLSCAQCHAGFRPVSLGPFKVDRPEAPLFLSTRSFIVFGAALVAPRPTIASGLQR
eukprot:6912232-Pyramimonas_sp.AAC.1